MVKDIKAIDCLYMPSEARMWESWLADCYIVTNISMLCLGKTTLSVCARVCVCRWGLWVCPLCTREHSDTSLGYLSGTLHCRYDYTQISTMPTEDTKQYSVRSSHTPLPASLPHTHSSPPLPNRNGELVAL